MGNPVEQALEHDDVERGAEPLMDSDDEEMVYCSMNTCLRLSSGCGAPHWTLAVAHCMRHKPGAVARRIPSLLALKTTNYGPCRSADYAEPVRPLRQDGEWLGLGASLHAASLSCVHTLGQVPAASPSYLHPC